MTGDAIFQLASMAALSGWLALLMSWAIPVWADRIAGVLLPGLLSVAYAGLVLGFWSRAHGGFGSLDAVMALFTGREVALAGWLHYLAFDLFVGAWEVRTARRERIGFLLVVPCLVLTFLFGPAGFLAFSGLRAAAATRRAVALEGLS